MLTNKDIMDELIELKEIRKVLEAEVGIFSDGLQVFSKNEKADIGKRKDSVDIELKLRMVTEKIKEYEDELFKSR